MTAATQFWGLVVESGVRYSKTMTTDVHITMAAIDSSSASGPSTLYTRIGEAEFVICNLSQKIPNQTLDLNFSEGEHVGFFIEGKTNVHLTGYTVMELEDVSDEEDMEEEEAPVLVPMKQETKSPEKKKKVEADKKAASNVTKKVEVQKKGVKENKPKFVEQKSLEQLLEEQGDSSDDEDWMDDEMDENAEEESEDGEEELGDEIEEEDEDEEEEEEESSGDEVSDLSEESEEAQKPAVKPTQKVGKQQNLVQKDVKESPTYTPKGGKEGKKPQTPVTNGHVEKTPGSKKKQKDKGKTEATTKTPDGKKRPREESGTPGGDSLSSSMKKKKMKDSPKSQNEPKTPTTPGGRKMLSGGVISEDVTVGTGPVAKHGRYVGVHYIGKLQENSKVFDKAMGGHPFKFRLGAKEVIRGWDIGVQGMKVGGKRRLTVPAGMAYGKTGCSPDIPPNSSLVFDIELKSVS